MLRPRCPQAFLCTLVFAAMACMAQPAAELPNPLTLADAKRIARAGYPGIAASAARIDAAMATIRETRSAYQPTVTLSASATRNQDVSSLQGGGSGYNSYALGGSASYLVFDGFARRFRVLAAEAGAEATQEAHREAQRILLQAVAAAYHNCLLGREAMRVAKKDAEFNQELTAETRKRLEVGTATRSDVLNFEIRATTAESSYVQAAFDHKVAQIVLAQLMGLPQERKPEDLQPAALPEEEGKLEIPALDGELEYALVHRPDHVQIERQVEQLEAGLKATRGDFLPTVGVGAGYGWSRADDARFNDSRDADSYVGAQLTWDLYSGGKTKAQMARQRAEIRSLRQNLALSRQAIMAELRQLVESAQVAKKQVELQTRIQAMTAEARRLVRGEYLAGRASLTRLNEAQTDLVRAEGALLRARILFWQALEDISAASGKILQAQQP
jgi:outer membrane protein TolC